MFNLQNCDYTRYLIVMIFDSMDGIFIFDIRAVDFQYFSTDFRMRDARRVPCLTLRYIVRQDEFYSKRHDARRIEITWFLRRFREALSDIHSRSMVRMRWIRKPSLGALYACTCVWVGKPFPFLGFLPLLYSGARRSKCACDLLFIFLVSSLHACIYE